MQVNTRLTQLDGLRGIFSLMVVIFHFPYEDEFASVFLTSNFLVRQGELFVDFFFVLSGFVISLNYSDNINSNSSLYKYLSNRFSRLYPLLLYTALVYLSFELIFNIFFPQLIKNPETVGQLLIQTVNTLFFLNSTPIIAGPGINFPSWSISSEMVSYIAFGLVVLYFGARKKYILGFIAIASGVFLMSIGNYMETYNFGFIRGLVCFITGYYTFLFFRKYQHIQISRFWEYIIPIALVLLLYIRFNYINNIQTFTLLTIPVFFGTAIYIFAVSNGYFVRLMSGKIFQYLGKISYSVYLNHAIIMVVMSKFIFNVIKLPVNEVNVTTTIILYIITVIVYSHFTYKIIEKKGRQFFKKKKLSSQV